MTDRVKTRRILAYPINFTVDPPNSSAEQGTMRQPVIQLLTLSAEQAPR